LSNKQKNDGIINQDVLLEFHHFLNTDPNFLAPRRDIFDVQA
jgi:hypothetical protein